MKRGERLDRPSPKRRGRALMSAAPEKRYWLGAPPREWLAVLFLPVAGGVIVAWLVHVVLRSDPPRTAQWLALSLGLGGGLVAGLAYTLRLALEHRLYLRGAAAIPRNRSRITTIGVPLGIMIALVVAVATGALQVAFLAALVGGGLGLEAGAVATSCACAAKGGSVRRVVPPMRPAVVNARSSPHRLHLCTTVVMPQRTASASSSLVPAAVPGRVGRPASGGENSSLSVSQRCRSSRTRLIAPTVERDRGRRLCAPLAARGAETTPQLARGGAFTMNVATPIVPVRTRSLTRKRGTDLALVPVDDPGRGALDVASRA
jgi:hypothetical protein